MLQNGHFERIVPHTLHETQFAKASGASLSDGYARFNKPVLFYGLSRCFKVEYNDPHTSNISRHCTVSLEGTGDYW